MKKQLQEPASSVVSRLEPSEKDDLISRKALMQRLHDAGGCGAPPESWADGYDKAIDLAYGMAENAPAIDAAPVVHGRWIFNQEQWTWDCTNCKGWVGSGVRISRYEYCPNCGAKMDGGNDNGNDRTNLFYRCDYGAPTTRRRFFLLARRDGKPIVWPQPTHGDPHSAAVQSGKLRPWRTASEIIDWTQPCPSIFERKKPLAENTLRRIARGIQKFVVENPEPFIVQVNHAGDRFRGQEITEPLCTANIVQLNNNCTGQPVTEPLHTVTAGAGHFAEVRALLIKYYGKGTAHSLMEPLDTITSRDRFGLVTISGTEYQIVDIGLRMLSPRELYNAQGFPSDYEIEFDCYGKAYPKSAQVARCGNAVPPPFATALARANVPEWCTGKSFQTMAEWADYVAV